MALVALSAPDLEDVAPYIAQAGYRHAADALARCTRYLRSEERIARATAFLVAQALGVTAHLEDVTSPPYDFVLPAKIEPPRFAPLACAELADAIARLRLAPGFASQLSGLVDDAWDAAPPVCRQKDLRTYMLLKEHAPTLDRRAFIKVDLDGPMSIWAALSLAELGWAPMFLLGPALHRGYNWSPVLGALKYVAQPLKAALQRLDEEAPIVQVTDFGVGVLNFQREAHEDPAIPPLAESEIARFSSASLRARIREAHASAIVGRVRIVLPRATDIAAHHRCRVVLRCHDEVAVDGLQPCPPSDVNEEASLPAYELRLNPYVERA